MAATALLQGWGGKGLLILSRYREDSPSEGHAQVSAGARGSLRIAHMLPGTLPLTPLCGSGNPAVLVCDFSGLQRLKELTYPLIVHKTVVPVSVLRGSSKLKNKTKQKTSLCVMG